MSDVWTAKELELKQESEAMLAEDKAAKEAEDREFEARQAEARRKSREDNKRLREAAAARAEAAKQWRAAVPALVLARAGGKCEGMLPGCTGKATQTFPAVTSVVVLWGFRAVCRSCYNATARY